MQDEKALNLRGQQLGISTQILVDLLNAPLEQFVDLVVCGKLLVTGIEDVVPFGPVSHRL